MSKIKKKQVGIAQLVFETINGDLKKDRIKKTHRLYAEHNLRLTEQLGENLLPFLVKHAGKLSQQLKWKWVDAVSVKILRFLLCLIQRDEVAQNWFANLPLDVLRSVHLFDYTKSKERHRVLAKEFILHLVVIHPKYANMSIYMPDSRNNRREYLVTLNGIADFLLTHPLDSDLLQLIKDLKSDYQSELERDSNGGGNAASRNRSKTTWGN